MEIFIVVANSCIHIVMYSYYFLCSLRDCPKFVQKFKPLLTLLQITQLVSMLGHCIVAIRPNCGATKIFYLQTLNIVILLFLFANFYKKAYLEKKKAPSQKGNKVN